MVVIRLRDNEKEDYLYNLISTVNLVSDNIDKDTTIKKSEWDIIVYKEVTRIIKTYIIPLFQLLQKTEDFGIYDEVILSNGGMPEFLDYMQLLEDKSNANTKIKEILTSFEITTKEELAKRWLNIAKNPLIEAKKELLVKIPEKYKAIEFYQKLEKMDIFDIRRPMEKLYIKSLDRNEETYFISWFNYVTGYGVWNIYIAKIKEIDPEIKGIKNIKNIFSMLKKNKEEKDRLGLFRHIGIGGDIEISQIFKKFLEDSISSGAFFLARDMDSRFETIYPESISMFQLGPFYIHGIKTGSLDLSWLFVENPKSYFLTATREDIESDGESRIVNNKEISIGKNNKINIGKKKINIFKKTKLIWRTDKFIEQRFGISSKELEKSLKEHIKFPDMRLYLN